MQQSDPTRPVDPAVEAELDRLAKSLIAELRKQYQGLFRTNPPKAFGPDLMRRRIAHRIQEKAFGGLSRETQRSLDQAIKEMATETGEQPQFRRRVRIKAGTELMRTWKGKSHCVAVLQQGFAYGGKSYASLSEIASLITGTRWSGPRFFGLRSTPERAAADGR